MTPGEPGDPQAAPAAVQLAVRRHLLAAATDAGEPGGTGDLVVACSGGADSLALLAATVHVTRPPGPLARRVVGVVVDHGLQDGSAEHTARVVAQMAGLGADETGSVRVRVQTDGHGLEAAAREARYAVLEEIAGRVGATAVLLGHTLDDQAETVLLGLTRGSGGRSIAGMRPGWGVFARPLLDVRRAETEAACRAQGIAWWDDPHNADPRFTRARVRHTVLPLLEAELGPGVAETLARTAAQLRPDMEALDRTAEEELGRRDDDGSGLDVRDLAALDVAVRTRVLRLAALRAGSPAAELHAVHVAALEAQVHNRTHLPRRLQLPGHVTAHREGDRLRFERVVRG